MTENKDLNMENESTSWTDPLTESATDAVRCVEDGLGSVGSGVYGFFYEHPRVGSVVAGGFGLGAAMAVGVGELAAAFFAGYVSYRMFSYGESFTEALEKGIKLEEGQLSDKDL